MHSFIHKWLSTAKEAIFPKTCFGCRRAGTYLCRDCLYELRDPDIFYPDGADFAVTSFSYRSPPIKAVIRKLKYDSASDVAEELASVMASDMTPYLSEGDEALIVPIPTSKKRMRARGFNQAEVLARALAAILHFECETLLVKAHPTKAQSDIKRRGERLLNIKNSFALNKKVLSFKGDTFSVVIVVDDIITTGATMSEAARVLKKAGAKKIICVAVAR